MVLNNEKNTVMMIIKERKEKERERERALSTNQFFVITPPSTLTPILHTSSIIRPVM
jgi:hypothetical protein